MQCAHNSGRRRRAFKGDEGTLIVELGLAAVLLILVVFGVVDRAMSTPVAPRGTTPSIERRTRTAASHQRPAST
jgi:hypothetical protein